jgi:hypothetical protein
MRRNTLLSLSLFVCFSASAWGQTAESQHSEASVPNQPEKNTSPQSRNDFPASVAPSIFLKNFAQDQKDIWTSPFKARIRDLEWLIPMAGLTAGLISADADISSGISTTSFLGRHSETFANAGVAVFVAGGGGLYFVGKWKGDGHAQETGILAGEAAIDSFLVDEAVKIATQRERPTDGTGQGRFWQGGSIDSSFPSDHAIVAWSIASVITHEYPGPLTDILAYGLATGISGARVTGKQHFTSDVLVGSTLGWLIGRQVYARHHQAELPERDHSRITPILDERTHAYGLHIEIAPTALVHPVRIWNGLTK